MTTKAKVAETTPLTLDDVRTYTPEEVVELKLLPVKLRWLKDKAYARHIPSTRVAGKLCFRLEHLLAISKAGDTGPANHGRRAA
jgi:hypothetical protein